MTLSDMNGNTVGRSCKTISVMKRRYEYSVLQIVCTLGGAHPLCFHGKRFLGHSDLNFIIILGVWQH
jgi:hypothetical protein